MVAETQQKRPRLARLDIARGIALIAMAIYHCAWDFEFFGYLDPATTTQGGWKLFARGIASSFLMLVGFSLVLAHGKGIRWSQSTRRLVQIGAAAAAITLATWYFTPGTFVFFGILHHIALASIIGLAFLRLPFPALFAMAAVVVAAPHYLRADWFDYPALWWVGLSTIPIKSNDYVPLLPWFAAVLTGMGLARLFQYGGFMRWLQGDIQPFWLNRPLTFIGRHSLAFYLIHQPVLISMVFLLSLVSPPVAQTPQQAFARTCEQGCAANSDKAFCQRFCSCVIADFEAKEIFDEVYAGKRDVENDPSVLDTITLCTESSEEMPPQ
ncbi:MAG: DUF1624 domain-containing protein [Phyllobacterium sp.]